MYKHAPPVFWRKRRLFLLQIYNIEKRWPNKNLVLGRPACTVRYLAMFSQAQVKCHFCNSKSKVDFPMCPIALLRLQSLDVSGPCLQPRLLVLLIGSINDWLSKSQGFPHWLAGQHRPLTRSRDQASTRDMLLSIPCFAT